MMPRLYLHAWTPGATEAAPYTNPRQHVKVRVSRDLEHGHRRVITSFAGRRDDARVIMGFLLAGYNASGFTVVVSGNEGRSFSAAARQQEA